MTSRRRTVPFGRYRRYQSWEIEDIPSSYLCWLLRTVQLSPWLHDAVSEKYWRRTDQYDSRDHREDRTPPPTVHGLHISPDEVPLARRVFDVGYRSLARAMHPDVGGDPDQMQKLNLLAESLRSQLEHLAEVRP
jgi:hypothetical protein